MRRSSVPGKQIGTIWGANSKDDSSWTRAKSNSYVKKLYFGWTTLRITALSTYGNSSWMCEKSYSPTRIRICDVNKLKKSMCRCTIKFYLASIKLEIRIRWLFFFSTKNMLNIESGFFMISYGNFNLKTLNPFPILLQIVAKMLRQNEGWMQGFRVNYLPTRISITFTLEVSIWQMV